MQSNIPLDPAKMKNLLALPEQSSPYDFEQDSKKQYNLFKDLLNNTELSKYLTDEHPYASIQSKHNLEKGCFVCLRTSYNCDQYLSLVIKDNTIISYYEHFLGNYSGYSCFYGSDNTVHEKIGYGFGSWNYKTYDLAGNQIRQRSEQSYGCCCG